METRFPFGLEGHRDLELSTQVLLKAAIEHGLQFEVLDRSSNTVRLDDNKGRNEIVIQATKTSKDSYLCAEIMSLKNVTKVLLSEAGLPIAQGQNYQGQQGQKQALQDLANSITGLDGPFANCFKGSLGCIVKPNSTNYGLGISRLDSQCTKQDCQHALEQAFNYDTNVLVEEFIPGKEYRFLVIGGKLQAVAHRMPANITGDGHSHIAELVQQKNQDPWRIGAQGGHISPLETIEINSTELAVLKEQGLTPNSVLSAGQQVFLRHNSNISTGGDSLDITDKVHTSYSQLAEACAHTLGAKICGIDVISKDITANPINTIHAVIEANFNPVLYIHEYPAIGQPRPVAKAVTALLFDR